MVVYTFIPLYTTTSINVQNYTLSNLESNENILYFYCVRVHVYCVYVFMYVTDLSFTATEGQTKGPAQRLLLFLPVLYHGTFYLRIY